MSDLEHATSLLRMAQADLNALRGMLSPGLPSHESFFSDEVFGFHAQQAAEKCLKAWIASLGARYRRTHDLMALIEDLSTAREDTTDLDALADLNPFAVEYRYEAFDPGDEQLDRGSVMAQIQARFDRVEAKIGSTNN
ncbi:MAG: HEPN domain-containing protein [Isosphaeraceae bacterium]